MMENNIAVYAFVGVIFSAIAYASFVMWSFAPEEYLHSLGITYYPSRYYAIALPSYIIVLYMLAGIMYIPWQSLTFLHHRFIYVYSVSYILCNSFVSIHHRLHMFTGIIYIGINMMNTLDPEDINTVMDTNCRNAPCVYIPCGSKEGIPDIADIHPAHISIVLADNDVHRRFHQK